MSRYIDANETLKELCDTCEYGKECENLPIEKRCTEYCIIANAPTADVAPVVHGRWVKHKELIKTPFAKNYDCSVCGKESYTTNFCPHCGAKMDEETGK